MGHPDDDKPAIDKIHCDAEGQFARGLKNYDERDTNEGDFRG